MMKIFWTRQNPSSLSPDFRPENGMNICRKWDGFRRNGEWAKRRWGGSASGVAAGEKRVCAAAAVASSRRERYDLVPLVFYETESFASCFPNSTRHLNHSFRILAPSLSV